MIAEECSLGLLFESHLETRSQRGSLHVLQAMSVYAKGTPIHQTATVRSKLDTNIMHLFWNCRRTRTRQTAKPFFVRVQNNDLRGLGDRHSTDSGGRFGRAGTAVSCVAAEVGKYMARYYICLRVCSSCRINPGWSITGNVFVQVSNQVPLKSWPSMSIEALVMPAYVPVDARILSQILSRIPTDFFFEYDIGRAVQY